MWLFVIRCCVAVAKDGAKKLYISHSSSPNDVMSFLSHTNSKHYTTVAFMLGISFSFTPFNNSIALMLT